jgi:hypothetical protein
MRNPDITGMNSAYMSATIKRREMLIRFVIRSFVLNNPSSSREKRRTKTVTDEHRNYRK